MSVTMTPDPVEPNNKFHLKAKEKLIAQGVRGTGQTMAEKRAAAKDGLNGKVDGCRPVEDMPLAGIGYGPASITENNLHDMPTIKVDVKPVPAGYRVGWKDITIALLVLVVVFQMLWILSDQGMF